LWVSFARQLLRPEARDLCAPEVDNIAFPGQFWQILFVGSEELLNHHPPEFLNRAFTKVDITGRCVEPGDLRVIQSHRQDVFLILSKGSGLRLSQLVFRPKLAPVCRRNENDAVSSRIAVDGLEVLVQILAPQGSGF
jgi:hypothetical protein